MNYVNVDPKALCEDLQMRVVEITYDKNDGEPQTMRCTLVKSLLPEKRDPLKVQEFHEFQEKSLNPTGDPRSQVITVWDIDNHGWRSFRIDRIRSAQMTNVN